MTFSVTNDNTSLFTVGGQPAVAADGTLTYTPAADASGSATVHVRAVDDGGGADTSAEQTFAIIVAPVNDAPGFTAGGDQSAFENAAAQSVPAWATAITRVQADEAGQVVSFTATAATRRSSRSAGSPRSPRTAC